MPKPTPTRARHPDAPSYVPTHLIETRAEHLLAEIAENGDVIAHGHGRFGEPLVFLLVTLYQPKFDEIAAYGAAREDLEATHDAEPDLCDETSLGWPINNATTAGHGYLPDGEEGLGPSPATVEAARARYRAKTAKGRAGR